jgi:L-alanine-DL-glutamate epimerase-like enolase superfamily enzyme
LLSLVRAAVCSQFGSPLSVQDIGPYVELSIEGPDYYPWQYRIFEPALVATDGKVAVPDSPGWGVEINPAWLDRARRMVSTVA